MKYLVALLLFLMAGCASTGISTQAYNKSVESREACLDKLENLAELLVSVEVTDFPPQTWKLPPFSWAPQSCNLRAHEKTWPDYSKVKETKCTWWLFPYERDKSVCRSTWELADGQWILAKFTCRNLNEGDF